MPDRARQRQPRCSQFGIFGNQKPPRRIIIAPVPQAVEGCGQIAEVKGHAVRFMADRCLFDNARPLRGKFHQSQLLGVQPVQIRRNLGYARLLHPPAKRMHPGMGILDIENRVVLGLFDHLGKIEIQLGIGALGQHDEASDILADFLHHLRQCHEIAGALRHFYWLASPEQPDHLHNFDVERHLPLGQRRNRGLLPLDRPGMIGTPDIDQLVRRLRFLEMIGKIGTEICPAAIRFHDRPVDIIAVAGRPEQGEFHRFPIIGEFPFGRLQRAPIDQTHRLQPRHRYLNRTGCLQFGFRGEFVVMNAEQCQIGPDQIHHRTG